MYVYPSIWEETSCIAAIEALGNGLHGIVTNYGALFETCSEWPTYIQYQRDYELLAEMFSYGINGVADILHTEGVQVMLDSQARFYKKYYSWENRQLEWTNFLEGIVNAKS